MKFRYFSLFLFVCVFFNAWATGNRVSANASCFFPLDKRFKEIFAESPFVQVDYSRELIQGNVTTLAIFGSAGYLYGSGSTNQGSKSHIHYVPFDFGVNALFPGGTGTPYIGLGPVIAYSRVHNDVGRFCSFDKHQNGVGVGARFRSGFYFEPTEVFLLNFFLDYYFTRVFYHYENTKIIKNDPYIQGFSVGFGVGGKF